MPESSLPDPPLANIESQNGTVWAGQRWMLLDQARGLALIAMIIYHAIWDGLHFGLTPWSIDLALGMQTAAQIIAGSFLFISGISLAIAHANMDGSSAGNLLKHRRFQKRLLIIALAALAVSIATFFALPQAPIYFGILHHVAFASVVLALLAPLHAFWLAALAGIIVVANQSIALEAFNHPTLIWFGIGTQGPVTADWVPVVPWLAAGLLGFAIAKRFIIPWRESKPPQKPASDGRRDMLTFLGQHSLATYLIHQPILIGIIYLYQSIT